MIRNNLKHDLVHKILQEVPRWVHEMPRDPSPCLVKLQRLGWSAGYAFSSHGVKMGVRTNDPSIIPQVASSYMPPRWRLTNPKGILDLYSIFVPQQLGKSNIKPYYLVYRGAGKVAKALSLKDALVEFEQDLHFSIAYLCRRNIFFNAGVVGWKDKAILILGPPHGGKSTLVDALVNRGATYYSDRYAVLDDEGMVHSYAKSPSFATGENQVLKKPLPVLCAKSYKESLKPSLLVLTEYHSKAKWQPLALSQAQGVFNLFSHVTAPDRNPTGTFDIIQSLASTAVILQGKRGEANEISDDLLRRLDKMT